MTNFSRGEITDKGLEDLGGGLSVLEHLKTLSMSFKK